MQQNVVLIQISTIPCLRQNVVTTGSRGLIGRLKKTRLSTSNAVNKLNSSPIRIDMYEQLGHFFKTELYLENLS